MVDLQELKNLRAERDRLALRLTALSVPETPDKEYAVAETMARESRAKYDRAIFRHADELIALAESSAPQSALREIVVDAREIIYALSIDNDDDEVAHCLLKRVDAALAATSDSPRDIDKKALDLAYRELGWMLSAFPDRRGGGFEEAFNAVRMALGKPPLRWQEEQTRDEVEK